MGGLCQVGVTKAGAGGRRQEAGAGDRRQWQEQEQQELVISYQLTVISYQLAVMEFVRM